MPKAPSNCRSQSCDPRVFFSGATAIRGRRVGPVALALTGFWGALPLDFLPELEGEQLDLLRTRFAVIACGQGAWEDVDSSWEAGNVLGSKGAPNRVDIWGEEWEHDWPTWRRMLPQYLNELLSAPTP